MRSKIRKWWKKRFQFNSIFQQLVSASLLISIIPIIFGSLFFWQKASKLAGNMIHNSYSSIVSQYISDMNEKFIEYQNCINLISENVIIRDNLLGDTEEKNPYLRGADVSVEVSKTLHLETSKELRHCMIYSNISSQPIYGNRVTTLDSASIEAWYLQERLERNGSFSYLSVDGKNKILSLIQSMIYVDTRNFSSQKIGFLKLDIDVAKLFAPARQDLEGNYLYDILVIDDKNNLLYASNPAYEDILNYISLEELTRDSMYPYGDVMVYSGTIDKNNYQVLFLFGMSQFSQEKKGILRSYLPMTVLTVIIVITATYCFTRQFSRRIELLVQKIKMAETGDLTVTGTIKGNDEIAVLDRQFSHMLKKLDSLIQKNYIQQLENKENELQNLQLQINPHFLYNTLETISSMAAIQQMFGICDICEKLGEIFRYSLGKNYGVYVTVEQEMHHVQNYVFIQKARFGNKFEFSYTIEPEVKNSRILRFILQPIVENAIIHGLVPQKTNGALEISIYRSQDCIFIRVEDDGVGMEPESVEELDAYINFREKKAVQESKNIGVRNVNQRIKLSCGESYGITITSEWNVGSCFLIKLPFIHNGGE